MLINELSKRTEVAIPTIRYYENLGLVTGVRDAKAKTNNYKYYDEVDVERLAIINEAKEVGFTLAEIKKLLENWYGSRSSKEERMLMFTTKISEIESKIKQFKAIKKRLESVVKKLEFDKDC